MAQIECGRGHLYDPDKYPACPYCNTNKRIIVASAGRTAPIRPFQGSSLASDQAAGAQGGPGMIAFASSFPGSIRAIEITPEHPVIVQKSGFLASEPGVQLSIHFQKRLSGGLFGGEGFIMQRLSGSGMAFIEIDGELVEYDLAPGQKMVIDTGNVAGFEPTVSIEIQQVPGLKNKFLGGEGLFNTTLTGPGKIWLQTMPISNVAMAIRPFIPTGNG